MMKKTIKSMKPHTMRIVLLFVILGAAAALPSCSHMIHPDYAAPAAMKIVVIVGAWVAFLFGVHLITKR